MKLGILLATVSVLALDISQAATFTVANTTDSGSGSLRQAILDANAATGDDVIAFTATGTITLASALPTVTDNTTISGPGTNLLTVSGNNSVKVFTLNAGTTNTISGLTIANGRATGNANGSGVANAGFLTISNCALLNNQTFGGWGGAAFNSGTIAIINSTFDGNQVSGEPGAGGHGNGSGCGGALMGGGGGGAGMGGGLFNISGTVKILDSSFTGNSASGGKGGNVRAAGCGQGGGFNGGAGNSSSWQPGQTGGFGGGGGGSQTAGGGNGGFGGGGGGGAYTGGVGGLGGGTGGFGSGGTASGAGGGGGIGGGIFMHSGTVTIVNCSFAGNQAVGGLGGQGDGGNGGNGGGIGPDFYSMAGTILPMLTATTLGGGTVTVDPPKPPYLSNSWAAVTATPSPGWRFLYWLGDASGTNEALSIKVTRNKYVQAVFGTALTNSALMFVYPQSDFYPYGALAKFTALPPAGTYFSAWSGDASGTNNPLSLGVTNPNQNIAYQLGALSGGQFALTVVENGRGRVEISPRTYRFNSGSLVTLTAVPDAAQDFIGWSGSTIGTSNQVVVTMDQSKVITATFTKRPSLRVGTPLEGFSEDGFRLTLLGEFGTPYTILGATNLQDWSAVGAVTNAYGTVQITDSGATNLPYRLYSAD